MKKVIVKCRVKNRERLEDKLSAIDLEFSPIYWLHDRIYVPRGYKPKNNFPRLIMRTEMHAVDEQPRYSLILKRHIEDSGIDIVETTPITDYTQTVNIIHELGFKQANEISRRRTELKLSDRVFMYLDDLDGHDNTCFAKLESVLDQDESSIAIKTSLVHTFKTLDEADIVEQSYLEML